MKTLSLLMMFVLLAVSPTVNATEDDREIPPTNAKWNEEEDPDRSLSNAPCVCLLRKAVRQCDHRHYRYARKHVSLRSDYRSCKYVLCYLY